MGGVERGTCTTMGAGGAARLEPAGGGARQPTVAACTRGLQRLVCAATASTCPPGVVTCMPCAVMGSSEPSLCPTTCTRTHVPRAS